MHLKTLLKSDDYLPTDLIEYRHLFNKYAKYKMFNTKALIHMANFMSITPVTGLNTINNILRLFKVQIPLDAPVIRHFTKHILAREMNMLFRSLREQDKLLDMEDIDEMDDEELAMICFKRGININ